MWPLHRCQCHCHCRLVAIWSGEFRYGQSISWAILDFMTVADDVVRSFVRRWHEMKLPPWRRRGSRYALNDKSIYKTPIQTPVMGHKQTKMPKYTYINPHTYLCLSLCVYNICLFVRAAQPVNSSALEAFYRRFYCGSVAVTSSVGKDNDFQLLRRHRWQANHQLWCQYVWRLFCRSKICCASDLISCIGTGIVNTIRCEDIKTDIHTTCKYI